MAQTCDTWLQDSPGPEAPRIWHASAEPPIRRLATIGMQGTAHHRRVLGIYLNTLAAFEVEQWKGRRVIRWPRQVADVSQAPTGNLSAC